jgi:hypothetical protein
MAEILEPFAFDAVYGAFRAAGRSTLNGKQVVAGVGRSIYAASRDSVEGE